MFRDRLPPSIFQWANHFEAAELERGVESYLLASLCHVESGGGTILHPPGRAGYGDWDKRDPAKWKFELPPPDPKTGEPRGWGFGLMQIDYGSHAEWLEANDWRDPRVNIFKGAELLRAALDIFAGDIEPAVASFNIGIEGVHHVLARLPEGSPFEARRAALDARSAPPHRYVTAVMNRRLSFLPLS